jgi:hypothetical protein
VEAQGKQRAQDLETIRNLEVQASELAQEAQRERNCRQGLETALELTKKERDEKSCQLEAAKEESVSAKPETLPTQPPAQHPFSFGGYERDWFSNTKQTSNADSKSEKKQSPGDKPETGSKQSLQSSNETSEGEMKNPTGEKSKTDGNEPAESSSSGTLQKDTEQISASSNAHVATQEDNQMAEMIRALEGLSI